MKTYTFKIKQRFLELIISGIKKHEYRLNDEYCSQIKIGDSLILISNENPNKVLKVTVSSISVFSSWEEALKGDWDQDFNGIYSNLNDILKVCSKFYKKDDVNKFGVIKFGLSDPSPKLKDNKVLLDTNIIIHRESYKDSSFSVATAYNQLNKLKSTLYIHPETIKEINKFKGEKKNIKINLNSYSTITTKEINDPYFIDALNSFSKSENSLIDNKILYEVYRGIVDILLTNDSGILKKAEKLGIKSHVFTCEEYLKKVSDEYPDLIDYKMLSVKREKFDDINLDDPFFDTLKEDYPEFENRFTKKNDEYAYVFKDKGKVLAFLYLKTEEENEKDYLKVTPHLVNNKKLKIGTFKIDNECKGFRLGERFLKIIFDNAKNNNAKEIYVTLFKNHRKEIDLLKNLFEQWGFIYYGIKKGTNCKNESVYVKKMNYYDSSKNVKFNFPNLIKDKKVFILPIKPEYHTNLFHDSILNNEDMNLYKDNLAHRYSLEKKYVSGAINKLPKPGDLLIIYRIGDRRPKKYTSVCTGVAVLEEIIRPETLDEYLKVCKNRTVFSKEELVSFYRNFPLVVKLIPIFSYKNKIILDMLHEIGLIEKGKGPRPFTEVPPKFYDILLEGNKL